MPSQNEGSLLYEEKWMLDQYMGFHFSDKNFFLFPELEKEMVPFLNFPKRIALACRDHCPEIFFNDKVNILTTTTTTTKTTKNLINIINKG
jgi:hypothetical protein